MNLYILKNFNNYTERKIKGYQTLTNYLPFLITNGEILNVNFNNNDGIYTEQVVMCDFDNLGFPDYLLVCDDEYNIVSRWFILNVSRQRSGKWRLELKHDLVYDNISSVVKNPNTLIKRGYASVNSPAIFNNEDNFTFNQIKESETYLKQFDILDEGFDCFLIAYIPKDEFGVEKHIVVRGKEQGGTYSDDYLELFMPNDTAGYSHTEDTPFEIIGVPFKHNWIDNQEDDTLTLNVYDSYPRMFDGLVDTGTMKVKEIYQFFQKLGGFAYDVQVVPYAPFKKTNFRKVAVNNIDFSYDFYEPAEFVSGLEFYYIQSTNPNNHNLLIKALPLICFTTSNFSFLGDLSIAGNYDPIGFKKIQSKNYRLVSPDYNSITELNKRFNYAISNNTINCGFTSFNAVCKLQPIQPFIYVEPDFRGLNYGNYYDNRGMLCNYNFSIAQTSDKWSEFLLNNKNYMLSFNRGVKRLNEQKTFASVSAGIGILGSTMQGASAGAKMGGGTGAVIGGAIGLAEGAYNFGETLYRSSANIQDYKDNFRWSCGNIQAMADNLNKISSLVPTNKIFPLIESYNCLYEEEVNFDNYLRLNGMTINLVGKIEDYYDSTYNFIQCSMIKFPSCSCTGAMLEELNKELDGGLFFESIS